MSSTPCVASASGRITFLSRSTSRSRSRRRWCSARWRAARSTRWRSSANLGAMAPTADKVTTATLRARKGTSERTAVLTAYDVVFARLADEAGIDVVLVGDSLGMVVQGERTTLAVT